MPIYEYRCSSCGQQQEFLQKLSDAPMTVCTACGKPTLSKMLTAAGFQLKGSGWYATDFKTRVPAPKADSASANKEAPSGVAKGESGSDAKGAPKTDAASAPKAESKGDSKSDAKSDAKGESKSGAKSDARPAAGPKSEGGKAAI